MNKQIANNRQEAESAARLLFGTGDHGPIKPAEIDGHVAQPAQSA